MPASTGRSRNWREQTDEDVEAGASSTRSSTSSRRAARDPRQLPLRRWRVHVHGWHDASAVRLPVHAHERDHRGELRRRGRLLQRRHVHRGRRRPVVRVLGGVPGALRRCMLAPTASTRAGGTSRSVTCSRTSGAERTPLPLAEQLHGLFDIRQRYDTRGLARRRRPVREHQPDGAARDRGRHPRALAQAEHLGLSARGDRAVPRERPGAEVPYSNIGMGLVQLMVEYMWHLPTYQTTQSFAGPGDSPLSSGLPGSRSRSSSAVHRHPRAMRARGRRTRSQYGICAGRSLDPYTPLAGHRRSRRDVGRG